jgi:hypothetical protein
METLTEKEAKQIVICINTVMELCDARNIINYEIFCREDLEIIIKKLTGGNQ